MPLAFRAANRSVPLVESDIDVPGCNKLAVVAQFGGQGIIRLSRMEGFQHRDSSFRHSRRSSFVDFERTFVAIKMLVVDLQLGDRCMQNRPRHQRCSTLVAMQDISASVRLVAARCTSLAIIFPLAC
jgi:hypothetical protein